VINVHQGNINPGGAGHAPLPAPRWRAWGPAATGPSRNCDASAFMARLAARPGPR